MKKKVRKLLVLGKKMTVIQIGEPRNKYLPPFAWRGKGK